MSAPSAKTTSLDTRKHVVTRQRAHILERAQAQLSSSTCRITIKKDDGGRRRISQTTEELSPSYASVSENHSESSMEAAAGASDGESVYGTPEEQSERHPNEQLVEKSPSRAWYEFDWAVLVALVAPACQWLTGGDYIKNLVMLVLLVYYLHQIIEGMHTSCIYSAWRCILSPFSSMADLPKGSCTTPVTSFTTCDH